MNYPTSFCLMREHQTCVGRYHFADGWAYCGCKCHRKIITHPAQTAEEMQADAKLIAKWDKRDKLAGEIKRFEDWQADFWKELEIVVDKKT